MSERKEMCPIWGTEASVKGGKGDYKIVDSPRAGGKYKATNTILDHDIIHMSNEDRVRLSTSILIQNFRGIVPEINSKNIQSMIRAGERNPNERLILLLKAIDSGLKNKFENFASDDQRYSCAVGAKDAFDKDELRATYFRELKDRGLVEGEFFMGPSDTVFEGNLTFKAYEKLGSYGLRLNTSEQIFVAMWFGHDMMSIYDSAIEPAIRGAGYEPMIISSKPTNNKIDDEILAEIRKSKAIIADLTCGIAFKQASVGADQIGAPRGGVYYEAGFAHGLGLPVIWTLDEEVAGIENVVHFDIQQYNQIRWNRDKLDDFSQALRQRIEATLGRGNAQNKT